MTETAARPGLGPVRLILGLVQGLALYALIEFPADLRTEHPALIAALTLVTAFVPITVLAGIAQLRPATLILWTLGATAVVAAAAAHAVLRNEPPTFDVWAPFFALAPLLFVAYHLVAGADADRRPIAGFRTYFDIGWKNGVQLALSQIFVGALWLLLWLGAQLFELIGIDLLRQIITKPWFVYPVTATAFAAAVHLSDVRVSLIAGARSLALMLLSWLLPVIALLAGAFLLTLLVTGLEPLWATKNTTPLLLWAAIVLVVLINATYQDGAQETPPPAVLRIGARLAALILAPLVAIAAYSIWLRIDQHGLTPERVVAVAAIVVAASHAAGYLVAALWPGRWMKPLEITNILSAVVAVGVILALLSPWGDPARIAVADQVRRLHLGLIEPDKFDFRFLRFDAGRYGIDALNRLKAESGNARAQAVAAKAQEALALAAPYLPAVPAAPTAQDMRTKVAVHPEGTTLPDSFWARDWTGDQWQLQCAGEGCDAFLADFDRDRQPEIVVVGRYVAVVFKQTAQNGWADIGTLHHARCGQALTNEMRAGRFTAIAPATSDIEIAGHRYPLTPPPIDCPPIPPR